MVKILSIVLILGGSSLLVYALTVGQDQADRPGRPPPPPRGLKKKTPPQTTSTAFGGGWC
jgi:hypothetical protein